MTKPSLTESLRKPGAVLLAAKKGILVCSLSTVHGLVLEAGRGMDISKIALDLEKHTPDGCIPFMEMTRDRLTVNFLKFEDAEKFLQDDCVEKAPPDSRSDYFLTNGSDN